MLFDVLRLSQADADAPGRPRLESMAGAKIAVEAKSPHGLELPAKISRPGRTAPLLQARPCPLAGASLSTTSTVAETLAEPCA